MLIRVRALGSYYDALTRAPQRLLGAGPYLRADSRNPVGHPGAEDRLVQR